MRARYAQYHPAVPGCRNPLRRRAGDVGTFRHRTLVFVVLFLSTLFLDGFATGQKMTVQGPESDTLVPVLTGYLLIDRSSREITAIELPSLRETVIRPSRPRDPNDDPTLHALSGPDAEGRIAYIEDHFFVPNENERRHLLKTIKLDGTRDTELFSRPGDAMWARNGEIGRHVALSPVGGRVAFLSALSKVQMPGALLHAGPVEIWDIEKKTGSKTDLKAVDLGLLWFPDGNRLAYVKLVEASAVPRWDKGNDAFGKAFQTWDKVPSVFIRDVDARTESLLHVGWLPVVSFDGQSVLVTDPDGAWRLVDVATAKSRAVTWRGTAWGGAIAMPAQDVVLSWSLPTEGTKIKHTENNSPLVGPKPMLALKAAKLNSEEFQTIVPYVDPRDRISFGQVRGKKEK